jgi:hypothetical protein
MPVILSPDDEEQWLDASQTPFVKAKSLLQPYPEELMDAHDVSPIVNSAKYDGPECIQPVSDDENTFHRAVVPFVTKPMKLKDITGSPERWSTPLGTMDVRISSPA